MKDIDKGRHQWNRVLKTQSKRFSKTKYCSGSKITMIKTWARMPMTKENQSNWNTGLWSQAVWGWCPFPPRVSRGGLPLSLSLPCWLQPPATQTQACRWEQDPMMREKHLERTSGPERSWDTWTPHLGKCHHEKEKRKERSLFFKLH